MSSKASKSSKSSPKPSHVGQDWLKSMRAQAEADLPADLPKDAEPTSAAEPKPTPWMTSHLVETGIQVGLIGFLVLACFLIIKPFLIAIIWGVIIAIAGYPAYLRLLDRMRGRRIWAASTFSVLFLLAIIGPIALLGGTLVEGSHDLIERVKQGESIIPAPPSSLAEWPLVGSMLHGIWAGAATNLEATVNHFAPQLMAVGHWLLEGAATAGLAVLQFLAAVFIAGFFLAQAEAAQRLAATIAERVSGARGLEFVELTTATVRSVTRGILGVALIQAILAGLGFLAAGVPAAGLWALLTFLSSMIQVGVFPVVIPIAIYVFFTTETWIAVLFLLWVLMVSVLDNVLKPILLGQGVAVPAGLVFIGAIGGLLSLGIIGLFIGPVVLVLGYTLFMAWLYPVS